PDVAAKSRNQRLVQSTRTKRLERGHLVEAETAKHIVLVRKSMVQPDIKLIHVRRFLFRANEVLRDARTIRRRHISQETTRDGIKLSRWNLIIGESGSYSCCRIGAQRIVNRRKSGEIAPAHRAGGNSERFRDGSSNPLALIIRKKECVIAPQRSADSSAILVQS